MRSVKILALLAVFAAGAANAQVALTLPLTPDGTVTVQKYQCDGGRDLQVQYINAGSNSLALIPLEGQDMVFVNVVSASGARYVAGMSEWWSKGRDATLSRGDEEQVACQAVTD